jgi:hypothetical protein
MINTVLCRSMYRSSNDDFGRHDHDRSVAVKTQPSVQAGGFSLAHALRLRESLRTVWGQKGLKRMWRSTLFAVVIAMMSSAVSAQNTFTPEPFAPDPQKIDSMTRSCVYHSAFYSQGAVICIGGGRGLQCTNANWVPIQDPSGCTGQVSTPPTR